MLLFGSITTGGGTGPNFWEFSPSQNPLIDIKQSTGATGLYQTTASGESVIVNTDDFGAGEKVTALIRSNATDTNVVAVIDDTANAGDKFILLYSEDTQAEAGQYMPLNAAGEVTLTSTKKSTGERVQRAQDFTSITDEASDNNTNASQHNQNHSIHAFRFYNPTTAAQKASYEMDETETRVKDGAGIKTFAVLKDGEIQTNQAQPHDNTINVLTWNVPIYDTTGTLLGYLRLYNP